MLPGYKTTLAHAINQRLGYSYCGGFIFVYVHPTNAGLHGAAGLLKYDFGIAQFFGNCIWLGNGLMQTQYGYKRKNERLHRLHCEGKNRQNGGM